MRFISSLKKYVYKKNTPEYFWFIRSKAIASGHVIPRLYYRYLYQRLMSKYGCFISLNTKFMDMPVFPHGLYGIFISGRAAIGQNVTIFHHVTIGSNSIAGSKNEGAPVICDNVFIGAGAIVAVSIPDNCTVVSEKPRIIQR